MSNVDLVHREFEQDGCRLHYWLGGRPDGPLVVYTHGASNDHTTFEKQLPALAGEYRILLWDVRGHGLSRPSLKPFTLQRAVDDLIALLDWIGYPRATFIGHSMGGMIIQDLAFYHPQRVKSLVAIGSPCTTLDLSLGDRLGLTLIWPTLHLYPYDRLKRQSARASAVRPEVQAWLLNLYNQVSKEEFIETLQATARCIHPEPAYCIPHPLLITHGDEDLTASVRRMAPIWAAREPNCRYEVIPAAGHAANMDNPAFFNRLLVDFLRKN